MDCGESYLRLHLMTPVQLYHTIQGGTRHSMRETTCCRSSGVARCLTTVISTTKSDQLTVALDTSSVGFVSISNNNVN